MQDQDVVIDRPCSDCHTPDAWKPLSSNRVFNHNETRFPLMKRHREAECIQCHPGESAAEQHAFSKARPECVTCHFDIHNGDFGSDCGRCHQPETWEMLGWRRDHDLTLFPLEGAHAQLPCRACHGGVFPSLMGNMDTTCETCHFPSVQDKIAAEEHTNNTDCIFCHNTRKWSPIDMAHHDLVFPIYSGSHRGVWSTCEAECHYDPNEYTVFSCGLEGEGGAVCHEHEKSKMDREHDEARDYRYESHACYDCHSRGRGGD